jgi:hypothetical protein
MVGQSTDQKRVKVWPMLVGSSFKSKNRRRLKFDDYGHADFMTNAYVH